MKLDLGEFNFQVIVLEKGMFNILSDYFFIQN